MLNMSARSFSSATPFDAETTTIGLIDILGALKRRWYLLALSIFLCLLIAGAVIRLTPPSYVAGAKVLIETRGSSSFSNSPSGFTIDTGFVDSQVEVLSSANISSSVIRSLRLQSDPRFTDKPKGEDVSMRAALTTFSRVISVRRIGQSYVIEISAQSRAPELAAKIANAITEVYLSGQWKYDRSPEVSRFTGEVRRAVAALSYAQIITRAEIPSGKSSPKTVLIIALALVSGLLLGGTLSIASDRGRSRLQSCRDISRCTGFKSLQTFPRISRSAAATLNAGLFRAERPPVAYLEALAALKVSLDTNLIDGEAHSIGILSLSVGGGSTTMIENLAKLYADADARVLIIDANFRSPFLSARLAPQATIGLLEMLKAPSKLHAFASIHERIAVLPLVGTHPSIHAIHVLRSPRMLSILDRAKSDFDVILIDMPAYATLIDGSSIKGVFDHTLVLCEWNKTRAADLANAMRELDLSGKASDSTIVLNKMPKERKPSSRTRRVAAKRALATKALS